MLGRDVWRPSAAESAPRLVLLAHSSHLRLLSTSYQSLPLKCAERRQPGRRP